MIRKLLIILALSSPVFAQTTIYTGVIKDLTGAVVTSGKVTFTLTPSTDSTVPGSGRFVPTTVTCSINSDGTLSAQPSGACTVASNSSLSPTGTSYKVCIQPYFASPGSCFFDYAITSSKDISTIAPTLSTGPINYGGVPGPQGIQGIQGIPGGSLSYPGVSSNGANGLSATGAVQAPIVGTIPTGAIVVAEGDSRTAGNALGCPTGPSQCTVAWPFFLVNLSQFLGRVYHNTAIGGSTIAIAAARYNTAVKPYCVAATATAPVYLFFFSLYNDINSGGLTGATAYTAYANYMHQAQADGCKVVAFTDYKWSTMPVANADRERNIFNTSVRADTTWNYLIDIDQLASNPNSTTWMNGDGVHWSIAGEQAAARFINSVFGGPVAQTNLETKRSVKGLSAYTDGDLVASRDDVTGALWEGSDGLFNLHRVGNDVTWTAPNGLVYQGGSLAACATGVCTPTGDSIGLLESYASFTSGGLRMGTDLNWTMIRSGPTTTWNTPGAVILNSIFESSATISAGTRFTISGCAATIASSTQSAVAGGFLSGTTGTCTVVVTMGGGISAPGGWVCSANNFTTANLIRQTGNTGTTATFSGTTVSGDVIAFGCQGY